MMAVAEIRPDWTIGTLNLTSGSINFTTTGSMLQTAAIQPGDEIITRSGLVLIIASITGQNSGTLMEPCPAGAAGSGQPLRIRFQPDGSRYNGATADLVQRLSSGNVYSLAGLDGSAGGVPVFTGPGIMEVVPTDEVGVPDPNGTLGELAALVLAANKVLTTGNNGDLELSSLGALGRALIALESGTSAQYIQGDGTLQDKSGLPVSTATQNALNGKANLSGANFTGDIATDGSISSRRNLLLGRNTQGRIYFYNDNAVYVGELGVSVGTGYGNSIGFFNEVSGNWSFNNSLSVSGSISAGSKPFKIDHPLYPFEKDLRFMATEAPVAGVEFWGVVRLKNGQAEVDIDAVSELSPGTFEALTQNATALSLNNLDSFTPVRATRIVGSRFTIFADDPNCNDEVSWMVKAERADPYIRTDPYCDPISGRLIPEFEKPEANDG